MLDAIRAAARETEGKPFARAIDRLVAAGIAHQLDDPDVSRALEYAEVTLPLHQETEELKIAIVSEVAAVFTRHGIADAATAARDMIDTAGLYGEHDPSSLTERVTRAVTGYLHSAPRVKKK